MKYSFFRHCVWVFTILGHSTLFAQTLSIESCIEKAQNHSPLLQQMPLIAAQESLQLSLLSHNYLPQASVNGQATLQSQVTSLPIKIPGIDIKAPAKDQYRVTVDVVQNIWDGGLTKAQKLQQSANARVEEKKVVADIEGIKEQVAQLFFAILLVDKQKAQLELQKQDWIAKKNRLQTAEQNGTAIKANVWAIEAKVIEIEQLIADLQFKKRAALAAMSLLTGEEYNENTSLATPTTVAINNEPIKRPEIFALEAQQSALAFNQALIKSKNLPKVSAFASGGYGRPGFNFLSRDFAFFGQVGAQVKVPLTHYYSRSASIESQQIDIAQKKIEAQKENILLGVKVKLTNYQQEALRLQGVMDTDKKLIELREKITKVIENQWENGIITHTEFLTEKNYEDLARQNLILHEVQWLQAMYMQQIIIGK